MKFLNLLNALKVSFKTAWQTCVMKGALRFPHLYAASVFGFDECEVGVNTAPILIILPQWA